MDPLAKKVAGTFLGRLKKAREGEIAANPVITNMENSDFVSEGYDKPEPMGALGPEDNVPDDGEQPPKAQAKPEKAQP